MKLCLIFCFLWTVQIAANPFAPGRSQDSAESEFVANLLRGATPRRQLVNGNLKERHIATAAINLTRYSVLFTKCLRATKSFAFGSKTIGRGQYVIFRLCPSGTTCASCKSPQGEYIIGLKGYLQAAVAYQKAVQSTTCASCKKKCSSNDDDKGNDDKTNKGSTGDDDKGGRFLSSSSISSNDDDNYDDDDKKMDQPAANGVNLGRFLSSSSVSSNDDDGADDDNVVKPPAAAGDQGNRFLSSSSTSLYCKSCLSKCKFIANLAKEGYYDASKFITCTRIYAKGNTVLYAGPTCAGAGSTIQIGVFTDRACTNLDPSKNPNNYLKNSKGGSMKLSYYLLSQTYAKSCVSCARMNNGVKETTQFCKSLYQGATKK